MSKLPKVSVRPGTKHPYVAVAPGMRACPLAYSTDVRKMVVPWVQELIGYKAKAVYDSFRTGKWKYTTH